MITTFSKHMLSKSFSKIKFKFVESNWNREETYAFGLYLHVPFCRMFCSFCPFYKVIYDEKLKEEYIQGVKKEIKMRKMRGKASWLYIGGGTPNLLKADEIAEIISHLRKFVEIEEIGMEGNPQGFTHEYLEKISHIGVSKISIGVETFHLKTLKAVKRASIKEEFIKKVVESAQGLGFSVNIDLMVGLPLQNVRDCIKDAEIIASIEPNQVTVYPYLVIPGVKVNPSMNSKQMFSVIEEFWSILESYGYSRDSIWVFSRNGRIYDSAKDELVHDYFGLGPAAFSTFGNVQVVNPPIELYLGMLKQNKRLVFRSQLDEKAKVWRRFSHELYKLRLDPTVIDNAPTSIKIMLKLLKLAGYLQGYQITDKGRYFVHEITKTVVESLPFPVNNPKVIENYSEYIETLKTLPVFK